MKKILFGFFALLITTATIAQNNTDWKKKVINRSGDHIMVQLTSDHWSGMPDSINKKQKGFSRGLGFSLMMDKPFKTDPHWSVAFGLSVNGSSMFFDKMNVGINTVGVTKLPFTNLDSANYFKKYKLVTAYLEVPVELRYSFNPEKENTGWKIALGLKTGTLINAHTKGKTLSDKSGRVLNSDIEKISKKTFFNSTRFVATARVGMGHFSLVCNYSLSSLLKDGTGPNIKPFQIGLCISGL